MDPVAREGIVKLYTMGGTSFVDKTFKRDAATTNSYMAQKIRKKFSTTSMLAGFKWDNPNFEVTSEAIHHYLETYKPRMDEVKGVKEIEEVFENAYYSTQKKETKDIGENNEENENNQSLESISNELTTIFSTFNQFFYRKLKDRTRNCICYDDCTPADCRIKKMKEKINTWFPSLGSLLSNIQFTILKRPVRVVLSPADSRIMVFNRLEDVSKFWIKGNLE